MGISKPGAKPLKALMPVPADSQPAQQSNPVDALPLTTDEIRKWGEAFVSVKLWLDGQINAPKQQPPQEVAIKVAAANVEYTELRAMVALSIEEIMEQRRLKLEDERKVTLTDLMADAIWQMRSDLAKIADNKLWFETMCRTVEAQFTVVCNREGNAMEQCKSLNDSISSHSDTLDRIVPLLRKYFNADPPTKPTEGIDFTPRGLCQWLKSWASYRWWQLNRDDRIGRFLRKTRNALTIIGVCLLLYCHGQLKSLRAEVDRLTPIERKYELARRWSAAEPLDIDNFRTLDCYYADTLFYAPGLAGLRTHIATHRQSPTAD